MKISVSSYSFQQYIGAGKLAHFDVIQKAHDMGFEAIEFIDLPAASYEEQVEYAKKLRAEADRLDMTINAYTIGSNLYRDTPEECEAEIQRLKGQVDIAAILGCSVMRHDVCYGTGKTGNSRSFGLMLPTIAANARAVTEYAATKGIKTCTENHGYIAQDSYRVEQLFNAVAHDNYGLLVDIGNFVCADEDNATAVSRVASYAVHVHAKDMYKSTEPKPGYGQTRGCNYFKGAIVGEGDCSVEKCLQILKRAGYDGYCSIEFEGSEDCIEGIAKGFENLKGMLERI
ncbi:MAG: sugar phosphate isomerase/epimerase [Ruminococcaceae bacterium]|nr:sugar phosphate isomerase/epimerase [Oscillospiraceae bacterium]